MRYKAGQVVIISRPATEYTQEYKGERAVITEIRPRDAFPYRVTLKTGHTIAFTSDELDPLPGDIPAGDPVNRPSHYTWLPGGIEVVDVAQNFNYNRGNILKYIMRAGRKGDEIEDLQKAAQYLEFEIKRMESHCGE